MLYIDEGWTCIINLCHDYKLWRAHAFLCVICMEIHKEYLMIKIHGLPMFQKYIVNILT